MKRSVILFFLFAMFFSFGSLAQETSKKYKKTKGYTGMKKITDLPYTANYSSDFAIAKMENAKIILTLYRDFENQDWTKDSWFADTVTIILPDSTVIKGKDQVIEAFKKQRAGLSSTSFEIAAIIPLKSLDHNQDWVALWGKQEMTMADNASGKAVIEFQTIWRLDKDKKVDFVHFYQAQPSKQQ